MHGRFKIISGGWLVAERLDVAIGSRCGVSGGR